MGTETPEMNRAEVTIPSNTEFIRHMREFCEEHRIAVTSFGMATMNNPGFITSLTKRKSVRMDTAVKVYGFMRDYTEMFEQIEIAEMEESGMDVPDKGNFERVIAFRLKKIRTELSLTPEEFGQKARVGKSFISKLENGECHLTTGQLEAICKAHKIPITFLLREFKYYQVAA